MHEVANDDAIRSCRQLLTFATRPAMVTNRRGCESWVLPDVLT